MSELKVLAFWFMPLLVWQLSLPHFDPCFTTLVPSFYYGKPLQVNYTHSKDGIQSDFECPTVFLGIHWALDKLKLTGSRYQLVNGILLLVTFGGIRLLWGTYNAYDFIKEISKPQVRKFLPENIRKLYMVSLASLQVLNCYWFYAMIQAITKRFSTPQAKKLNKAA